MFLSFTAPWSLVYIFICFQTCKIINFRKKMPKNSGHESVKHNKKLFLKTLEFNLYFYSFMKFKLTGDFSL